MHRITLGIALLTLLSLAAASSAEVVDAADNGFTVRNAATVSVPAGQVFGTLVNDVAGWWHPSHTFSGDAGNLRIEPRPQGCFCETLPDGGGVRHMTVVYLDPGKTLRLVGGLGPLQGQAVSGALTWALEEGDEGTTITSTYAVHGYAPGGLDGWAGAVDGVLRQQLERLVRYVESGDPEAPAEPPADAGPAADAAGGDDG